MLLDFFETPYSCILYNKRLYITATPVITFTYVGIHKIWSTTWTVNSELYKASVQIEKFEDTVD